MFGVELTFEGDVEMFLLVAIQSISLIASTWLYTRWLRDRAIYARVIQARRINEISD